MQQEQREIIISKEDAVFWMDKNGAWHNEHGKFEHPRIIKYFNASIKKDENGYYVLQETPECKEKVYFRYEDTALFVFDIKINEDIVLILNTNDTMPFDPKQLFSRDDNLYIQTSEHRVKFKDRALLKISKFMEEKDGQLFFKIKGKTYPVQYRGETAP